jgi:hypothetical protein
MAEYQKTNVRPEHDPSELRNRIAENRLRATELIAQARAALKRASSNKWLNSTWPRLPPD